MRTLSLEEVKLVSGGDCSSSDDSSSSDNGHSDSEQRSSVQDAQDLWTFVNVTIGSRLGGVGGALIGYGASRGTIEPREPAQPPTGGNCPTCHDGGPGNP